MLKIKIRAAMKKMTMRMLMAGDLVVVSGDRETLPLS